MRLSEARLEASDVGALVRWVHPCGGSFVGGGQVGVLKRTSSPPGTSAAWNGGAVSGRGVR